MSMKSSWSLGNKSETIKYEFLLILVNINIKQYPSEKVITQIEKLEEVGVVCEITRAFRPRF